MNTEKLILLIRQLHIEANKLCKDKFGKYFLNAGNVGIFCQSDEAYEKLTALRKGITEESDNPNQKYFKLNSPMVIEGIEDIPATTYTHLYIRKPDPTPYGKFIGDIDFYTDSQELNEIKDVVKYGSISGAEIYTQAGVGDMIQLSSPEFKTVAYISIKEMTESVRIRH